MSRLFHVEPVGVNDLPGARLASLLDRLRRQGIEVGPVTPIVGAELNNNRLWTIETRGRGRLVAKLYYRDDRRRMAREAGLLERLARRGVDAVPRLLLRADDLDAAVLTCEEGALVGAADLTDGQIGQIAAFAAALHRLRPHDEDAGSDPAVGSAFSYADVLAVIRARLALYAAAAADPQRPAAVAALARKNPEAAVEALAAAALRGLSAASVARPISRAEWRVNTSDLATNNILARDDGRLVFLDFEYAGWDDPAALPAGFLTHARSIDLSPAQAALFVERFIAEADPTPVARARLDRTVALQHVVWCAVHLSSLGPAYIARKRFATPDLDVESFVATQCRRFEERLLIARTAIERHR